MSINFSNLSSYFFRRIVNYLSVKPLITTVSSVIIVIAVYTFFFSSKVANETAVVKQGDLKQVVEVTGSIQASRDANLSFQTLGAVSYVGVKVGDVVGQGQTLATLQSGDAQASLLQAKAQLESAEATFGQLTEGFRKEEIAIKQQAVDNAKNSLEQVYVSLPDTIRNVDAVTSDIIKSKLGTVFNTSGYYYTISFNSCDQSTQSKIEMDRTNLEILLSNFQKKSSTISSISTKEDTDSIFEQAYTVTISTNNLISDLSKLLVTSCSIQNTSLDSTRSTLSTARTTMNTLFSDITTKRASLNSAKNVLSQATRDLELANAGTDPYKLKAQAASVSQAEAQVALAEAGLRKTVISAPFFGTISDVSVTEGETVTSGKSVISMLAIDSFEIEAKIPEIDIVKIKVGAPVDVTLDAYGKAVIFPATVTRVNPTATIEGSVPIYKAIITFTGKDERIKSGMTSNVKIITENKTNIVIIPSRFVEIKDNVHGIVTVRKNNIDSTKDVLLGIRGQDGLIEILSGVSVGDEVVAPSIGIRSAQKQTQ